MSREGFSYRHHPDGACQVVTGPMGGHMLYAWHRSVTSYIADGLCVVVDDLMLSATSQTDWVEALRDVPHLWVHMRCPVDVAEKREAHRNRVPGLVRGHAIMPMAINYDVVIDSPTATPEDHARTILKAASGLSSGLTESSACGPI